MDILVTDDYPIIYHGVKHTLAQHKKPIRRRERLVTAGKIKELQWMVEALYDSERQLDAQLRFQSHIISSIAHDIRTPLRFTQYNLARVSELLNAGKMSDAQKVIELLAVSIEKVRFFADGLVGLMTARNYARIDPKEAIPLRDFILERCRLFFADISLEEQLVLDIPERLVVNSNRHLLGIIIQNLIDNAVKHSNGKPTRIYSALNGETTTVWVCNYLPNHAEDVYKLIKHTLSSQETQYAESTGLGLHIVREIAAATNITLCPECGPQEIRIAVQIC